MTAALQAPMHTTLHEVQQVANQEENNTLCWRKWGQDTTAAAAALVRGPVSATWINGPPWIQ